MPRVLVYDLALLSPASYSFQVMPTIRTGILKGFYKPDYGSGSIVNLLASIIRSRGGFSPHPSLKPMDTGRLERAAKVIYLLVDGLGKHQLDTYLDNGYGRHFFARHRHRVISSVFPATTAAAVTTYATGASPTEHGVLSWWLNLHDLGTVGNVLIEETRLGAPLKGPDFNLHEYLQMPSYLNSTTGERALLSYGHITESTLSNAGTRWTRKTGYETLTGMREAVLQFARSSCHGLAYVYWPELDTRCHAYGCFDSVTVKHFDQIDEVLASIAAELRGTDSVLLVTADHGLVDTPEDRYVDLSAVPGLYDTLATLPAGDSRQLSFFIRPSLRREFMAYGRSFTEIGVLVPGARLIRGGYFGPGHPHPGLKGRVGDYVLIARDNYAFDAPPTGMPAGSLIGTHGGMSKEEMRVPLYVIGD